MNSLQRFLAGFTSTIAIRMLGCIFLAVGVVWFTIACSRIETNEGKLLEVSGLCFSIGYFLLFHTYDSVHFWIESIYGTLPLKLVLFAVGTFIFGCLTRIPIYEHLIFGIFVGFGLLVTLCAVPLVSQSISRPR